MKFTHLLVAALAASSLVQAQVGDGSVTGGGSSVQVHPDGTTGFSSIIQGSSSPGPSANDGMTSGPVLGPQEQGAVSLNKNGGTLDGNSWVSGHWFVHKVVAPRKLRIESFEFFCQMTSSHTVVTTGLFLDQSGKPSSSPVRTSSMNAYKTAAFRRSTLASAVTVSRGQVFYIGYKVPSSSFRVSLTGGSNGTYYWDRSAPAWSGPFSTRKFAWRVNSFMAGLSYTFGAACNTPSTKGQGTGEFAGGLNVDAVANDSRSYVTNGKFVHRIVAGRDMYVDGASFLSKRDSGAGSTNVYLYQSNGSSSGPGTLLRSGTMSLSTSSRWNRASWAPIYMKRGTVFYVGYQAPSGLRVSVGDLPATTYYYQAPSASSWNGPFSTTPFAVRIHSSPAVGDNLRASGNTTDKFIRGATFLHREIAASDMWVSGFGFRCRVASGSSSVRFALHLADSSGKPLNSSVRAVTRVVNSSSSMDDVHFSPVFLSKGTRYFVGYTVPSSSSVSFYPQASGSGLYNTGYYWKDATATSWAGPYTSRPFAKRIYTSRTQLNPYTTGTNSATFSANSYFLMRSVAPSDMWVDGFEMFTELNAGRSTVSTVLFLGNGSGGRPGSLVRAATMEVDTSATWRRTQFQTPYFVAKGTVFYVGVRTPSSSSTPMRLRSSSGSNATYYWRRSSETSWRGSYTMPMAFKVHGRTGAMRLAYSGDAEIGGTLNMHLVGASASRIYGLVLGSSSSRWGAFRLPLTLPFGSGCQLQVSYDQVLATGRTSSGGEAKVPLRIPSAPSLIGVSFFNQFWMLESTSRGLEMSWSNAGRVTLGG